MAEKKGKKLAWSAALAGAALLLASLWLLRGPLLERWWIHRLGAAGEEARNEAARRLGEEGSGRAVEPLLRAFAERSIVEPAIEALGKIFRRGKTAVRVRIIEGLLEPHDEQADLETVLRRLVHGVWDFLEGEGPREPAAFPLFRRELGGSWARLAAQVLAKAWPGSRDELALAFAEASREEAAKLVGGFQELRVNNPLFIRRKPWRHVPIGPLPETEALLRHFARHHERPEIRALCLAASVERRHPAGAEPYDLALLHEAPAGDPDPLVRRAALRIAGALGERPGTLDLRQMLLREEDAAELLEVIRARTRWLVPEAGSFELADGLSSPLRAALSQPAFLDPAEIERLERLLLTESDPELREAAAFALAARFRHPGGREGPGARAPGLKLRECGVWREGAGAAWRAAISFEAPDPVVLLLRLRTHGGGPKSGASLQGIEIEQPPASKLSLTEWCGLRAGYGAGLEGEPAASIESGDWRSHLGRGALLALGGRRSRLLAYDLSSPAFAPPLLASWSDEGRRRLRLRTRNFSLDPPPDDSHLSLAEIWEREVPPATGYLPGALVVLKEEGKEPRGGFLADLPPAWGPVDVDLEGLDVTGAQLGRKLEEVLAGGGLERRDAAALADAWRPELFDAPGLRLLTFLPLWLYESALGLEAWPLPGEVERIGIVWKECGVLEVDRNSADEEPEEARGSSAPVVTEPIALDWKELQPAGRSGALLGRDADGRLSGLDLQDQCLLAAGGERLVWLRPSRSGDEIHCGELESGESRLVAALPAGARAAELAVSADGSRLAWTAREGGEWLLLVAGAAGEMHAEVLRGDLSSPALSADGRTLAVLDGRSAVLADLERRQAVRARVPEMEGENGDPPRSLALSGDAGRLSLLIPAGQAAVLALIDCRKWQVIWTAKVPRDTLHRLAPGGEALLSWREGNGLDPVHLYEPAGGRSLRLGHQDIGQRGLPALTPGGRRLLFILYGALWSTDLETGISRRVLGAEGLRITRASISTDGQRLLFRGVSSADGAPAGFYLRQVE
jgi:HEAT repeat protein